MTLAQLLVGLAASGMVIFGTMLFVGKFSTTSNDWARRVEANTRLGEVADVIQRRWQGRARNSNDFCDCPAGATGPNCPPATGGPCLSFHLIPGPAPDCAGLRIHQPSNPTPEVREYVTFCHSDRHPSLPRGVAGGELGALGSTQPVCPANRRPIVRELTLRVGEPAVVRFHPDPNDNVISASSVCFQQAGGNIIADIRALVRATNRMRGIHHRLTLSVNDRSSNVEYLR
jgi:hypothetical protein